MTRSNLRRLTWELGVPAVLLIALVVMVLTLAGCAAATGKDGKVIVGFDVAQLAETPEQVLRTAGEFLPEPWKSLAIGAGSLLAGSGAVGYAAKRARQMADNAFDEGVARAGSPTIVPAPSAPQA